MVLLSQDAAIPEAKLTQYLLIPLPTDDKSKFLVKAGYTLDNWRKMEEDLRTQVLSQPAELIETNKYGQKYCIRITLTGENGIDATMAATASNSRKVGAAIRTQTSTTRRIS